jgi:hypothetical protein
VEPLETYAFLAPRRLSEAPLEWCTLQRDWWKGTTKPSPAPKPKPWSNTLPLDKDWAFRPLANGLKEAESLAGVETDDHAWDRMDIGVWYGAKYPNTTCGVFRKRFAVPRAWQGDGRTWLWIRGQSPGAPTRPPHKLRVSLDGKPVTGGEHGYICDEVTARLTPGEHTLTVATETLSAIGGIVGNVWLEHIPEPAARQSLAGDWNGITLPGTAATMHRDQVRREFVPALRPPYGGRGKRAVLYVEATGNNINHILLNGRLINRDFAGRHFLMDITPFLSPDRANTLSLGAMYATHPTDVRIVEIRYYDPDRL